MAGVATQSEKWLNKKEAAALLNVSTRQIERLAESGRIEKRYTRPGGGNRWGGIHYTESTLLAIQEERVQGIHMTGLSKKPGESVALVAASGQTAAWSALAEHLAKLGGAYPAPKAIPAAWLTLEEAALHSGLTKSWLLKEAEDGEGSIATRDMGKHARGGRWRFFRGDLERAE